MVSRVGQQLGNYQLMSLLGEGGFAKVYLGEHIHLGTQAAIKVLHTQLTSSDVEQFRTEARTIARLEHPHIVHILDFGLDGTTPFLVMSYAPNGTLRQRHPKGTNTVNLRPKGGRERTRKFQVWHTVRKKQKKKELSDVQITATGCR